MFPSGTEKTRDKWHNHITFMICNNNNIGISPHLDWIILWRDLHGKLLRASALWISDFWQVCCCMSIFYPQTGVERLSLHPLRQWEPCQCANTYTDLYAMCNIQNNNVMANFEYILYVFLFITSYKKLLCTRKIHIVPTWHLGLWHSCHFQA